MENNNVYPKLCILYMLTKTFWEHENDLFNEAMLSEFDSSRILLFTD